MYFHTLSLLRKDYSPLFILGFYFLFLLLFISLSGNFPLNDDWTYGEGVHTLLTTGKLVMPAACAAGFTHVFLGTTFCKIFGFSYTVLRTAIFIFGYMGSLAFYAALRLLGTHRNTAIFCTLLYASNPLMVNLYFSFMSDITALSLVSIYLFVLLSSIKKNSILLAICSIVLFTLAVGARQSAIIFLPCTFALMALKIKNRNLLYLLMIFAFAIPCLSYLGLDYWLINRSYVTHDYAEVRQGHLLFIQNLLTSPMQSCYKILVALGQSMCYLGLFCLPVLLPFVLRSKETLTKYFNSLWPWLSLSGITILISIKELVLTQAKLMPFNQNLLRLPMICALTIMGLNVPLLSKRYLKWLTALSYGLAFILLTIIGALITRLFTAWSKYKKSKSITAQRLAIIWICTSSLLSSLAFSVVETIVRCTDRYYLIALGPLILGLVLMTRWLKINLIQPISIIALLLLAFYSACAAQDYLGWNRARWIELDRLEARGISPTEIDGGYEYNTLRDIKIYDTYYHGESPRDTWRWWPIKGEKYIISFSTIPGYKVIDRTPYWSALTFSFLEVLVLQNEKSE